MALPSRIVAGLTVCVFLTPGHAQWLNYKSPGIPRTSDGKPNFSAPPPRSVDGKPDLTGVWQQELSSQDPPKVQPWAEALSKRRMEELRRDSPEALCLPGPITNMGLGRIVQTPRLLLMLYGGTYYREIFLDGRELPKNPNPVWMGYSVGHWDGDTLVIDTTGFNDRTWLTGTGVPGSPSLHIIERIHRPSFGHIEVRSIYTDPSVLEAPREITTKYALEDVQPLEYVCNENERDHGHLIGKASDLQSLELDPKVLGEYAGSYEAKDRVYVFVVSDGRLRLSIGPSTYLLTTLSETAFADNNGVRYDFFRDTGGAVSYVLAQPFGGDIKAMRRK